ncbi:MAG: YciI family protein [Gemmatimonadaceae bacterium]
MRYMLMMHAPSGTGDYQINTWPADDFNAHIDFMRDINRELIAAGELVDVQGLTPPGNAKIIRAAAHGAAPPTDGVFPETKEFLAGYWIIDVDSAERAYEVAAKASAAPGPGGTPLNMPIEVRQVMSVPPPRDRRTRRLTATSGTCCGTSAPRCSVLLRVDTETSLRLKTRFRKR